MQVMNKYLTGGIACFDKEGSPVRVERFGLLDTKGIVYSCRMADLQKFKLQEQELCYRMMKQQSQKVSDLDTFTPEQAPPLDS